MTPDDDLTAAEEIRLLREEQRAARRGLVLLVVTLAVVGAVVYSLWGADRYGDNYGSCIRDRRVPIEQC